MSNKFRLYAVIFLSVCVLFISGCGSAEYEFESYEFTELFSETELISEISSEASVSNDEVESVIPETPDRVDEIYDILTMEEKVCQLVIAREDDGDDGTPFADVAANYPVGGVCMFKSSFKDLDSAGVKAKISEFNTHARIPMLVSVDEEGGSVVRVSSNSKLRESKFRSPSELFAEGGYDRIKADTAEKSQFLRALGINVNFAPVADVVTSKDGFLYDRAFRMGTSETAKYVETVVREMNNNKVGSFIKHFPGYGNSTGDTHKGADVNTKQLSEIEAVDLPPFVAGFAAGADGVMVTHTIINAIDETKPASLSPKVCSYIREKIGFDGLIITDGLDMEAILQHCGDTDPALAAILAGADIALIPLHADESCQALIEAADSGVLSEARIEQSVKRILRLKLKLGLIT